MEGLTWDERDERVLESTELLDRCVRRIEHDLFLGGAMQSD